MVGHHVMVSNNTSFGQYLCYQLDFLLDFLTEEGSYQWLKDATSFGLLSDKSTEKLEWENSNFGHFSIGWVGCHIMVL